MTFTVTYRNGQGAKVTLVLEAANKAEVWTELKKRKINAISVTEGGVAAKKRNTALHGPLAGVLLVVLLCGVLYFLFNGSDDEVSSIKEEKRTSVIAEHEPSTNKVAQASGKKETAEDAPALKLKTYRDKKGILRYEGGARVPGQRPLAKPIELGSHIPKVFKHSAEEHISWLLEMKIGEPIIGDYEYGDHFRKSFKESLAEPTEILDTDDEATRELKKAVQETKEELRLRMEAGEDIAKVMNDTMDEFRRLARYKHDLQLQLNKIRQDTDKYTDKDIKDFTAAANEMLKKQGIPPITMPRAVMRGLRNK